MLQDSDKEIQRFDFFFTKSNQKHNTTPIQTKSTKQTKPVNPTSSHWVTKEILCTQMHIQIWFPLHKRKGKPFHWNSALIRRVAVAS